MITYMHRSVDSENDLRRQTKRKFRITKWGDVKAGKKFPHGWVEILITRRFF